MLGLIALSLGWALALPAILAVYARLLMLSARQGGLGRIVLSVVGWALTSLALVAALLTFVAQAGGSEASTPAVFAAIGLFALASLPGALLWHRTFLPRLRAAGFFRPRR